MATNTINIKVDSLSSVRQVFDKIKVYKSSTINGTYTEITNSGTRINLNAQDTLYAYIDVVGLVTDYYKTSYYNSTNFAESQLSDPVPANIDTSIQLEPNMQVIIQLSADIKSLAGVFLATELEYFFTTTYTPMYSSVRKVRLEIGAFIVDLDDDAVNLAIFEASLGADEMTWVKPIPGLENKFYQWAKREWATCKTAQSLLFNVISGLRSKKLDNFEVTYDFQKRGQSMLDQIDKCLAKWEPQLKSGGAATQKPKGAVKGEFDIDAPHVGRLWEKGPFTQQVSGANLRYEPMGSRRYISGWKRNVAWRRYV